MRTNLRTTSITNENLPGPDCASDKFGNLTNMLKYRSKNLNDITGQCEVVDTEHVLNQC